MQFESSYSHIKKISIELTQQNLQVFPSTLKSIDPHKSCILKLNGTAGLFYERSRKKINNLFDIKKHDDLMDNLNYLIDILEDNYTRANMEPLFSFAWEKEDIVLETRKLAAGIIKDTEILVIIGYSLPGFNNTVDKEIFKDIPNLKKIYYQAPNDELPDLLDKLDGININMRPMTKGIKNIDTFYVPTELISAL